MRKFLLSFALLVAGAMSVGAQTLADGVYTISNGTGGRGTMCYGTYDGTEYFGMANITLSGHGFRSVTVADVANKYWYVTTRNGETYIYNIGKGFFLQPHAEEAAKCGENATGGFVLEKVDKSDKTYYRVKDNSHYLSYCCYTLPEAQMRWLTNTEEAATLTTFTAVENGETTYAEIINDVDELLTPAEISYTLTDEAGNDFSGSYTGLRGVLPTFTGAAGYSISGEKWSDDGLNLTATINFPFAVSSNEVTNATMITNGASWTNNDIKKWHAVNVDGSYYVKVQTAASNLVDISSWLWAIYPSFNNGAFTFTIKNIATGTYVLANPELTGNSNDVQGNTKPVSLSTEGTAFTYELRANNYCNFAYKNSNNTRLVLSINGSGDTDKFLGVYNGSHNGNDIGFPSVMDNTVFPFPVSKEGEENWTMMCCMPSGTPCYVYFNGVNVVTKSTHAGNGTSYLPTATEDEISKWLWAIYPTLTNGAFTFQIKNASAEKFVYGSDANVNLIVSDIATDFSYSATNGGNGFCRPGTDLFFNTNSSGEGVKICNLWKKGTNTSHKGAALTFPKLSYTVYVGDTGYATLYTPVAVTIPTDVTAYTGTINNEWLTLSEVSTTIPANTGVMLKGVVKTTFVFNGAEDVDAIAENALTGSAETIATNSITDGTPYTLQGHEGGVAFKKYTGESLKGYKAYLVLPTGAKAIGIRFEDGTTGIDHSELTIQNSELIFDLMGRRVETMTEGNIYIVNGKKVVIK